MGTIGIKIPVTAALANCVRAMRPFMTFSIAALKEKIQNHEYVYECEYIDTDGVGIAIRMVKALAQAGIKAECYEHDRPCSVAFFRNWHQTGIEIEREMEEEDEDRL